MKINSFTTKTGQIINLNKISVLVGANNAGKSQTLRDIKDRMDIGLASQTVILSDIDFNFGTNKDELLESLKEKNKSTNTNFYLHGIASNLLEPYEFEYGNSWIDDNFNAYQNYHFTLGNISRFRVAHLDSSTRLNLVRKVPAFNPNEQQPQNILQTLLTEAAMEDELKRAFKLAFGMDIKLDWSGFIELCLIVAKELPNIPDDPRQAYPITKNLKKIDSEGDGFKSFTGILLGILLCKDRIILLDEPEAFLHPAQARFLGKWIADYSQNLTGQLLIATHSSNFLSGILSSDKSVDIYRLNRNEDNTKYNLIPNEATKKLTTSSLLSSQRVLESIFHKGVVVCEADADRAVYQSVSTLEFNNQEILFIHSHNKQTLKDVAGLLKDACIPVAIIADIDLLNDEHDYISLIRALSGTELDPRLLERRQQIAQSVNQISDYDCLEILKSQCNELLQQLNNGEHSFDGAKGAIQRVSRSFTKWNEPKEKGIEGFDEGIRQEVINLLSDLRQYGIFIVPVGELEGWINVGVKRKNKWIVPALEEIYKMRAPKTLIEFVNQVITFFK